MEMLDKFRGNIFSKRQKRLRDDKLDVYQYDDLPKELRVQIVQIWQRFFEQHAIKTQHDPNYSYQNIVEYLRHERGVIKLPSSGTVTGDGYLGELAKYFDQEQDIEKALDVVEASFRAIEEKNNFIRELRLPSVNEILDSRVSDAIDNLNFRFNEHGVGYRYESTQIIRIDDEFIHEEVVKPALRILNQTLPFENILFYQFN